MKREWKPGELAVIAQPGSGNEVIAVRRASGRVGCWHQLSDDRCYAEKAVESVRPLVVIDPEDRERVARLASEYVKAGRLINRESESRIDDLQAALRSLITTPKPAEPTGLGAVVEDANGDRWVRTFPDGGPAKWRVASLDLDREPWAVWSAIAAVRVLSEGVQPC